MPCGGGVGGTVGRRASKLLWFWELPQRAGGDWGVSAAGTRAWEERGVTGSPRRSAGEGETSGETFSLFLPGGEGTSIVHVYSQILPEGRWSQRWPEPWEDADVGDCCGDRFRGE